jgi:DNA sulfur modification protein DndC
MQDAATTQRLPIAPHRLTPAISDTVWVNLIGRGYPAPRHKFRWCTERLKIRPSNAFIRRVVRDHGEVILVLGIRKAESQARARSMEKHEGRRLRDRLSPNASLPNSLVYSPVEDWTNDDVWLFLMQVSNPWGYNNKDLLTMYQGASPDGECPLVVDNTTPSCGDSRFGCWVCTLVEKDKSMQAMIQNDQEKEWMLPLLTLRNELDVTDDRHLRDFRRMSGSVQLFHDRVIPGPYTQASRERSLAPHCPASHCREWPRLPRGANYAS